MLRTTTALSCDECPVRKHSICAALSPAELEELSATGRRRIIAAGKSFIWENDESTLVANVIDGVVKLSAGAEDGRQLTVSVAYPSDFIGRPFGRTIQNAVTALTDATICMFSRADFDSFAASHPALEHNLLERTLIELDRARRSIWQLGRNGSEQKVASFLLDLSSRLGNLERNPAEALDRFELPFSRQQIADILGLTIETVSRQMTRLKRSHVIGLPSRRGVVILNRGALKNLAR